ncbi:MAG: hypothetical protein Kapaf2KO_04170 [Candidatus Kapaibacteriales bacterium]
MYKIYILAIISFVFVACDNSDKPEKEPSQIIEEMKSALASINSAELDVEYFYKSNNDEPFSDEFKMIMERDSLDPSVSARIMIEPYNRFSGYLLTYMDGEYRAIDSNRKKIFIADKENKGSEIIRNSYRGDIASIYFDRLYDFAPTHSESFIDDDTIIGGESFYRLINLIVDSVENTNERFIWYINKKTMLPMEWTRSMESDGDKVILNTKIKSLKKDIAIEDAIFKQDLLVNYSEYELEYHSDDSNLESALQMGTLAPDFTLSNATDNQITLSSFKGKPTVLKFWGTWCSYCKKTLPQMQELKDKYDGKVNFVLVSANEPSGAQPQTYLDDNGYSLNTLVSGDEILEDYKVDGFPMIYILDKDGKVAKSFKGFDEKLSEYISATIQEMI